MSDTRLDRIDATTRNAPRLGGFSWTFFGIELKRLFKNYSVIIFTVVFPIAMLVLVGLPLKSRSISDVSVADGGMSAAVPIMISMAVYAALVGSTMTGVTVAAERGQGWSRQLRLTPLNPAVYILIKVATGMVLAAIAVVVTLVAGALLGITAPLGNVLLAGFVAWLTSMSMTSLGLAVGYAFPAQNAIRYMGPLLPVLSFMGGLFVPLYLMPDLLQVAAKFTPLWGIADLAQSAVIGVAPDPWAIPNLVVWFVIFTGLAVMFFRRDTARV
ncbi:ABC transporter permease [Microbacterium gorillae]|uniref:ABC transporter permease n=1 Tax=Microbacterium gorillae TaxID=1231063 RepID=UPI000591490C|nr:ABC transporter permease [Microbacterium gorillae]